MEQFPLPSTFVFKREYKRWKDAYSPAIDFGDHPLSKATEGWGTELFSTGSIITIVEQTRSLAGIKWKTEDGKLFAPSELQRLLDEGTLEPSTNATILKLPRPE